MATEPGTTFGHYQILAAIGKGGMGEVWKARDTTLGRDVAIKTLPAEFAQDADRLARFEREAKLLASLNHPNIAAIYGLEEQDQTRFLVLELVDGDTLADRIQRGAIPVEEALKLALQIAEALEAAHEKGVIHRDLKPANIKVTDEGTVKVLDFGLAKAFVGESAAVSVSNSPTLSMAATQQGVILGTAAYMSPEQAKGRATDKRTDIWAFGAVLYEMLTGKPAFPGDDVSDILGSVLKLEPAWDALDSTLHPRLRELLERCLEKTVRRRYHDIADVRGDIERVLDDPAGLAVRSSAAGAALHRGSRVKWAAALAAVAVVAAVAAWSLKPVPAGAIYRFAHALPDGQQLPFSNRTVVALSPDGSRMAYVAGDELYLKPMDALEAAPVPGTDERPVAPVFSPDGEWIAYVSNGQLKKTAVSGGVPIAIAKADYPFGSLVWDPDNTIVWGQDDGLMRVSADGGVPEVLLAGSGDVTFGEPQILPDGKAVLFNNGTPTAGVVTVASLATGERTALFPGVFPRYVSTGHIAYGLDNVLFAVPFNLATLAVTGGPVPLVEGVQSDAMQYALSDSGSLAYVPGHAGNPNRLLAFVDREGVRTALNAPAKRYVSPRLSPDGTTLVVESFEDSGNVLWRYDLSGTTAIQQLTFQGNNHRPVWTPNGERIAFSSDRDGPMSLYWMPADGSGVPERLTTAEEGTSHWAGSWSPDGRTLAFNIERLRQTDWDIWTLSLDDGTTESLYDTPGTTYMGAELSPDGRWLAYSAGPAAASTDIYVEPFPPTGARRRISQTGGYWPLWSSDGTQLIYRRAGRREGLLRSVDISLDPTFAFSNERELAVRDFAVVGYYRDYDLTPDGKRLLMVFPEVLADAAPAARSQINIVLNWTKELLQRVPVK